MWLLSTLLVRTQTKMRTIAELYNLRDYLNHHEQTVGRNMDVKKAAGKGSESNEEHVIENGRKEHACYIVSESSVELFPTVMWKTEL